jgi:hypothetical protein
MTKKGSNLNLTKEIKEFVKWISDYLIHYFIFRYYLLFVTVSEPVKTNFRSFMILAPMDLISSNKKCLQIIFKKGDIYIGRPIYTYPINI